MKNLNEQKEHVVNCYQKTYDKDIAYLKCGLTKEEIKILDNDLEFQQRLNYILAEEKEFIIGRLRTLSSSADKDSVALSAVVKLGEILYAEVFNSIKDDKETQLVLPIETQKKLKDIFTSGTMDAWKKQIQEKLLVEDQTAEDTINEVIN